MLKVTNKKQNTLNMSKVVRAKQTLAGDYGLKHAGDEFLVTNQTAQELASKGTVEIIGDSDIDVGGPKIGVVKIRSHVKAPGDNPAHPDSETNPYHATNESKNIKPKF